MNAEGFRLYDPTAEPRAVAARLAPRLTSLAGTRVGILDNGKPNAGPLMLAVATILRERHGVREVVKRDKPVGGPPRAPHPPHRSGRPCCAVAPLDSAIRSRALNAGHQTRLSWRSAGASAARTHRERAGNPAASASPATRASASAT